MISIDGDAAGGSVSASGHLLLNGSAAVVHGDGVAPHPPCPTMPSHCAATMIASSHLLLNGSAAVVGGDAATCGHTITGSGHLRL